MACLKIAFCGVCATIWYKYTAKQGVQTMRINFQTRPGSNFSLQHSSVFYNGSQISSSAFCNLLYASLPDAPYISCK